ncbi:response regulator [Hymenobacter caeli]|uniref:CheY-like chemotaxis protein n=1 Tax=Hymenobacter caeli TaxID=2735894 RepID=A0ABX2FK39_9BACT|nr:response regulator [Hymenobacter caeli]NRT17208.1 CheY-like chemotaxis protein [Hymenobacter caeli]
MNKLSSVLLVDDDPTTNFVSEHLLRALGVTEHILVAHNGEEALAQLARACPPLGPACPALILLDVNMPVMSGIEFLEAYYPQPPSPPTVVVVLTTTTHPGDLARLAGFPVAEVITKPLTLGKLEALMQQHFRAPGAG